MRAEVMFGYRKQREDGKSETGCQELFRHDLAPLNYLPTNNPKHSPFLKMLLPSYSF